MAVDIATHVSAPAALLQLHPDYCPHTWLYTEKPQHRSNEPYVAAVQWIEVFRKSTPTFKKHAQQDTSVQPESRRLSSADAFESAFLAALDVLEKDHLAEIPGFKSQPLTCLTLCDIRERCLRNAGFQDVFKGVKAEEDESALQILPSALKELDGITSTPDRVELALRGVFAGNIFDLGAAASAQLHASGATGASSFAATRDTLVTRPWAIDDLEGVRDAIAGGFYRKAVLFVDNAGSDVVLGMIPLAREMVKLGTEVILAANEGPSINDITASELEKLVAQVAALDEGVVGRAVASGALKVMSSGNWLPVIDLTQLDPKLVEAAADADVIILEGMGRAIETNLHAQMTCDSIKLGMIKHPEVAHLLGGRLYDCVCKLTKGKPLPL